MYIEGTTKFSSDLSPEEKIIGYLFYITSSRENILSRVDEYLFYNPVCKEIFIECKKQYKQNRKKGRENDSKDWDSIFGLLNAMKSEFKEILPYKFIEVYGAEADDIIATLCKEHQDQKIMIISGDKDFIQLQKYENVSQYSPILKKMVNGHNPDTYIKEHILKGDSSDGVPNVLSPDHTFVEGLRQRPLSKKKIEAWIKSETGMSDEVKRNYQRNHKLINLDNTPEDLQKSILDTFNEAPCGDRSKILTYFIENKLKELTDSIGDF